MSHSVVTQIDSSCTVLINQDYYSSSAVSNIVNQLLVSVNQDFEVVVLLLGPFSGALIK